MKKLVLYCHIYISIFIVNSCSKKQNIEDTILLKEVSQKQSNVTFENTITESDSLNYYTYPYAYLGGGVSVGDINNDQKPDIFFTGNMVKNKLYINKGRFLFQDISEKANISGDLRWYTGTTMVDINNDGWLDVYVCVSGKKGNHENQLYINNKNETFSEQAKAYGLNDNSNSIQATFFDYNNDGHIDVYIANYPNEKVSMGNLFYKQKIKENLWENSGHLYENRGNGKFIDVTQKSGLQHFGMSLGVVASDFNNDGWKDLYISNDFNVPDYLFINNKNGTFSEQIKSATNHTSMFGMGIDAGDFNNDGLLDIAQVDMTSGNHFKSKTNMASMQPESFKQAIDLGFHYQYMQNSLQLNRGTKNDTLPYFSDISRLSNISTTDWSWGVLFADLNNNGLQDIVISNGIKRDVNNNDILQKHRNTSFSGNIKPDYREIPQTPVSNFLFQNNSDLTFSDVTSISGFDKKGFSNGIVYSDLDLDGDLDIVINNVDSPVSIYENKSKKSNFLKIALKGNNTNLYGLGTKIEVTTEDGQKQYKELTLTRGYQSSVEPILHFGIHKSQIADIKIIWPDNKIQELKNIKANQFLTFKYEDADFTLTQNKAKFKFNFKDITSDLNIHYKHQEDKYNDYKFEPLLPHKNSQLGPALAVSDYNSDGLDDIFIGGAKNQKAQLLQQNTNGTFKLQSGPWELDFKQEDTGAIFKDFDSDGDLDLYVISGGNYLEETQGFYQDRLYVNIKGDFKSIELPKINSSGLSIQTADYDKNNTLDIFVGGRILPGKYPHAPKSYLLQNNGKKDFELAFRDITDDIIPQIKNAGLITDALWTDFDKDDDLDLLVVGEWMPIQLYINNGSTFSLSKEKTLSNTRGWWNTIQSYDIDQDGDEDYILGNLGLNYKYKTSSDSPFEIYANDFDNNKSHDIVLSYEKDGKKYPVRGRQCSSEQVPAIARRFKTYSEFANSSLIDIYGKAPLDESLHYQVDHFDHVWIKNNKNKFKITSLPTQTQISSINTITPFKYKKQNYFLMAGNLFQSEVETPRNDAGIGVILNTNLKAIEKSVSGLFLNKDVKKILPIKIKNRETCFVVSNNNDVLQVIEVQ